MDDFFTDLAAEVDVPTTVAAEETAAVLAAEPCSDLLVLGTVPVEAATLVAPVETGMVVVVCEAKCGLRRGLTTETPSSLGSVTFFA